MNLTASPDGWVTFTIQHFLVLSLNYVTLFYIAVGLVVLLLVVGRFRKHRF